MANVAIQASHTNMGAPPSSAEDHKIVTPHINWFTDYIVRTKANFTAEYGTKHAFNVDNAFGEGSIQNPGAGGIWSEHGTHGWKYESYKTGVSHSHNVEIKANQNNRWMPAAMYNGCAFEWHADYGSTHALWLHHWATIWVHKTNSVYRFSSNDGSSGPYAGYRYYKDNNANYINTIRSWGTDYLFFGIVLKFKNSGSGAGSHKTTIKMFNFKMYHQCHSRSSNHRIIIPATRAFDSRGTNNIGYG